MLMKTVLKSSISNQKAEYMVIDCINQFGDCCLEVVRNGKTTHSGEIYDVFSSYYDSADLIFKINPYNLVHMSLTEEIIGISYYIGKAYKCDLKEYEYFNKDYIRVIEIIGRNSKGQYSYIINEFSTTSINHKKYIKSEDWNIKRKAKLKEAEYKCQLCSANETELHVHHNNYNNLGHEEMSDLIVLCKECHSRFHNKLEIENKEE